MYEEVLHNVREVHRIPEHITDGLFTKGYQFLALHCYKSDAQNFGGRVREFLIIEVCVFMFYVFSMFFVMIKSRLVSVGLNKSYQFEKQYMHLMVEKITYEIDISQNDQGKSAQFYVDYERLIVVDGVNLKICLN